jgi:hypothetical protein
MQSISDLAQASTFIFSGTVLERGASSVPFVQPHEQLITARFDNSLRVDPVLGDLRGKTITVIVSSAEAFEPGQKLVFFANSAVHGRGIAVREVAHVDAGEASKVAAVVGQLPERHLLDRLQQASVVVEATIEKVDPPAFSFDQHDGRWAAAHLKVADTLKGKAPASSVMHFATAEWPPYDRMPKFAPGESGIFLLQPPPVDSVKEGGTLPADALVAVDPADFQDASHATRIRRLLTALH